MSNNADCPDPSETTSRELCSTLASHGQLQVLGSFQAERDIPSFRKGSQIPSDLTSHPDASGSNPERQEDGNVDEALEEHRANLKTLELRLVREVRAGSPIRKKACEIANMLHDARIISASANQRNTLLSNLMAGSDMAHVISFTRKEETAIRLQVDALLTENDRAVTRQPNPEGSLVTNS
jgi:hypothetical protein